MKTETSQAREAPAAAAAAPGATERKPRGKRRLIGALLLAALIQTSGAASASWVVPGLDGMGGVLLAGGLEAAPQWHQILAERSDGSRAVPDELVEPLAAEPREAQIKAVNYLVNQVPYRADLEAWGAEDYWASPREFFARGGDCEDYAVAKYFALRALGFAAEQLFVMVARDEVLGRSHAVLVVLGPAGVLVLDNRSNLIVPWREFRDHRPIYWINETASWFQLAAR